MSARMILAALIAIGCGSDDDGARAAPPPPPTAIPGPPLAPVTPREARPVTQRPALADLITEAREAARDIDIPVDEPSGPHVTLYYIDTDHDRVVKTGAVWLKFQGGFDKGLKSCYRTLLRKQKNARGQVRLAVVVGSGGSLDSAKVIETFDESMNSCLEGRANGWKVGVLGETVGAKLTLVVGFDH